MNLKSIFARNLKSLMAANDENANELAERLGVSNSAVSEWRRGRKMPRSGGLQKLADHYHVNVTDLLKDLINIPPVSNYNKVDTPHNSLNNEIATKSSYFSITDTDNPRLYQVSIPVLGKIACGDPILSEQNIEEYRQLLFDHKPFGTLFSLKCKGDSMEPIIPDGSFVTIRQQDTVENGEMAAVLIGDEATVKRVKRVDDTIFLIPENQKYDPIILDKDHPGKIIGKVVHVDYDIL